MRAARGLSTIALALVATSARADPRGTTQPSLAWAGPQLLPSPGLLVTDGRGSFTLGWQLTPVLYTFGTHARSHWRSFVVAPMLREGGSVGLVAGPELYFSRPGAPLAGRVGLTTHLPIWEWGDTLSTSLGVSHVRTDRNDSAWGEVGLHTLFGTFGLVFRASPRFEGHAAGMLELHVRYF